MKREYDRRELACLRITPSGYFQPAATHKLTLVQQGDNCWIETAEQLGRKRKQSRTSVAPETVAQQLELLRNASIPAFPISPLVCDGEYEELTIHGEFSNLTLGWWTIAPAGADGLAEFAGWLRGLGLPDEDDQEDDNG
ncbi:hypothetical protein A1353_17145 [Methylomonas methanica]|uniref:Uncharacterized protein n=1 Tax=Methylomonas methanica TaxID=421 RepID=A0A177MA38_METMH|nr:hypothetical protein [Methylomonas methanica]OAI02235.1 hypothetical protein A1353_17145 [Methylomonas methanica]